MTRTLAHAIAGSLVADLARAGDGVVLGGGGGAVYARLGETVVAVTARGVPRMPKGIGVGVGPRDLSRVAAGQAAKHAPGRLMLDRMEIVWDPHAPPVWFAGVRPVPRDAARSIRSRLVRLGRSGHPSPELRAIARSVASRRIPDARALGEALAGSGPGLTPEGDDLLAGTALAVRALGPSSGWSAAAMEAWLQALLPPALAARTPLLSEALLRLAVEGFGIEPVLRLLSLADPDPRAALLGLLGVGHSTGTAYAAALGAVASTLDTQPKGWR